MSEINSDSTQTVRETPKAKRYVLHIRKNLKEGRVMTTLISRLPNILIPPEETLCKINDVIVVLYEVKCQITEKSYIGRTVSHRFHYGFYKAFSLQNRLDEHIRHSNRKGKNRQCKAFYDAIREFGIESFSIRKIGACDFNDSEYWETKAINDFDTMYPKGYNMRMIDRVIRYTDDQRKNMSKTTRKNSNIARYIKFVNVNLPSDRTPESFIKCAFRSIGTDIEKIQTGWRVIYSIGRNIILKTEFAGEHTSLDEYFIQAYKFVKFLQKPCNERDPNEFKEILNITDEDLVNCE